MTIQIKEGMSWPPKDVERFKMEEHGAWFSGEPSLLANFYYDADLKNVLDGLNYSVRNNNKFWGRQIKNDSNFFIHVPVANDIAETSASFLFGESPLVRFKTDKTDAMKKAQEELDKMLTTSGFYSRILEAAEVCSGLGGIYIKVSWDSDLSDEPIPVVVQPEVAFPVFKFGKLQSVQFVYEVDTDGSTVYRLSENIEKGKIVNTLYQGSSDKLGDIVDLSSCSATEGMEDEVKTPDILTCIYVPNLLPNKLNRQSSCGRSDYQGIETLMDALDEVFSAWMVDVQLARGRIHVPSEYLKDNGNGDGKFNTDKIIYEELEVDPTALGNSPITPVQFEIRAAEFEQTCLNLLDRIITSAGYSPQSFGLNIAGRAESGTALNVRERKSFATTNKKQSYWEGSLKHLVKAMCMVRGEMFSKPFTCELDVNIAFADGVSNNLSEIAGAVKMLFDAKAASIDTRVRMIHPEWSDSQVEEEVTRILNDDSAGTPQDNPDDLSQLSFNNLGKNTKGEGEEPTEGNDEGQILKGGLDDLTK